MVLFFINSNNISEIAELTKEATPNKMINETMINIPKSPTKNPPKLIYSVWLSGVGVLITNIFKLNINIINNTIHIKEKTEKITDDIYNLLPSLSIISPLYLLLLYI